MKSGLRKIVVGVFVMSVMSVNTASADVDKIAVVDLQKVVSSSSQVKVLKDEQYKKATELEKWLQIAKKDIEKQSTAENKQKLIKKYDAELARKREMNTKEYNKKLGEIDESVSRTIATFAKSKNYDLVLAKSNVLFGGIDITNEIMKLVK